MKRAQITLFVIIGIVIVAVAVISFYLLKTSSTSEQEIIVALEDIETAEEFKEEMQFCLQEDIASGLIQIEAKGGYYQMPENSLTGITSYYLYEGKETIPTLEQIQDEIEAYSKNSICKEAIADNVIISSSDAYATIGQDFVKVSLSMPAILKTKDGMIEVSGNYDIKLASNLKKSLEIANKVIESEANNRGMISLTMLSDYNVTAITGEDRIVVYQISDELLAQTYGNANLRFATKW